MNKFPDLNQLMNMAQGLSKQMEEQLNAIQVEGNSGGGMVQVTMNGHKHILTLTIASEVIDPNESEMLQDLIMAAIHDAQSKAEEKLKENMAALTGGLPGGFPFGTI